MTVTMGYGMETLQEAHITKHLFFILSSNSYSHTINRNVNGRKQIKSYQQHEQQQLVPDLPNVFPLNIVQLTRHHIWQDVLW